MNAWPVIQRELRAEARNRSNYWSRVYAGLLLVLMSGGVMFFVEDGNPGRLGGLLFGNVHTVLVVLIWLGTPLMTADCIARERRDGTLGLLFLTPLAPSGVAVGKSVVHALRSMTLLLVAVPVLALPVMMGGVTWKDGLLALILDATGLMLGLSAGLLASTLTVSLTRAVVLAELISLMMLVLFSASCGLEFVLQAFPMVPIARGMELPSLQILIAITFVSGLVAVSDVAGLWREAWTHFPPTLQDGLLWAAARNLVLFGGLAGCVVGVAAWRLRRLRMAEREPPRAVRLARAFVVPRFGLGLLRRKNRRLLQRNPIAWLQGYSTAARLAKWTWCLLVSLGILLPFHMARLEGSVVSEQNWLEWALGMFAVLCTGLAFSAITSFRRERETGALELILVSPLRVGQIIRGRLQGIWLQFLPSMVVLGGATVYFSASRLFTLDGMPVWMIVVSTYLTMPVLGLFFATFSGNWIAGWLATYLVGLGCFLAPEACMWVVGTVVHVVTTHTFELNNDVVRGINDFWSATEGRQLVRSHVLPFISQWLVALGAGLGLYWRLKRRAFAFK